MFGHNDSFNKTNANPDPSMMNDPPLVNPTPSVTPVPSIPEPEPEPDHSSNPIATAQPIEPAPQPDETPETPTEAHVSSEPASTSDLLEIKQKALEQLTPLVGKLDQDPEEKFHTTMMMIQANDNQKLLNEAYQAAQNITDDKKRAQALLDVINEVNYFTQQNNN